MASKPTDSQELKLGPGWTSLSKSASHHHPPPVVNPNPSAPPAAASSSAAPRISYSKMELLDLYEPESTATIPTTMAVYPGLTSSYPLVPVNIAPEDHTSPASALVEPAESTPRARFQPSAPRPGVEAILGRDHPQPSLGLAASPSNGDPPLASTAPTKKPGQVAQSSRDFWSGSAVLAAAERPNPAGPPSERRPLPLKPRSVAADRAPSPNGQSADKAQQQPYWSRTGTRGAADTNSNWRGGGTANSSVASGGVKYPGASADEIVLGDRPVASNAPPSQNPRKSTGDLTASQQFPHSTNSGTGRSSFPREGNLFSRNNKDTLKPTNTRDLSALAKGSSRDPAAASTAQHQERDTRDARHHAIATSPSKTHAEMVADEEKLWFYRDPQGNIQGPFSSSQLIQWEKDRYYDAELPVSKSREHGFKPLAIAFGMRKDEPPAASPPPGFISNAAPPKKEAAGPASPMSMRPSREERNRRGTRTVAEMAEEVEMMRLQNRNNRMGPKGQSEDTAHDNEKNFFDTGEISTSKENGHRVLDEPLEDRHAKRNIKPEASDDVTTQNTEKVPVSSAIHSRAVSVALQPDAPITQSRFASFMKQGVDPLENKSENLQASADLSNGPVAVVVEPQNTRIVDEHTPKSEINIGRAESAVDTGRGDVQSPGSHGATTWTSMMMDLRQQSQQQPGTVPSMTSMPPTASEQDIMAIDPAIAHASFSRPSVHASPLASPRANSSDLPSWLHVTGPVESNDRMHSRDPLHDPTQVMPTQSTLQVPLSAHITSHERAQMQAEAQARAQVEARARAELIRQAQVQAQVQARQLQAQQEAQLQAQAQQQAQVQQQAQARAAQHASAMAQVQARVNPQEQLWILRHRLNQLQASYDGTYRAHLDTTRSMQAAQAAVSSSLSGSHENQSARAVVAQLTTVMKEQALQLERIKGAAQSTHTLILQHSMAAAHGQQQRQAHAQGSVHSPEAHENMSPHTLTQAETHSPKQSTSGMTPINAATQISANLDSPQPAVGGQTLVGLGDRRVEDGVQRTRRNLNSSYDALDIEEEGWEKVNKKTKAVGMEIKDNPVSEATAAASQTGDILSGDSRKEGVAIPVEASKAANGSFQTESESRLIGIEEPASHEVFDEAPDMATAHSDAAPAIAPWSKAAAGTGNGLSLREIQRQEELRSKAEEKTVSVQQEQEEASKAAAARWNPSMQPWGGAGDPTKQQTLSFKEKMRLEEEQKKRSASHLARPLGIPSQSHVPAVSARPLTTKTGWASLVAKTSRPQQAIRKPAPSVAGKRVTEETPFWESVGPQSHSVAASAPRPSRQNYASSASHPVHPAAAARAVAVKPPAPVPVVPKKPVMQAKPSRKEDRDASPSGENAVIGRRVSNEFANWCSENLKNLTGNKIQDTVMFDYLVAIKSPSEIKDTILQNLGANEKTRSFADEFIRRLEFERSSVVADAGSGGTGGRKKGRRHRAAKVDPSLVLGFTSTSSRIMQGTIETPEMK